VGISGQYAINPLLSHAALPARNQGFIGLKGARELNGFLPFWVVSSIRLASRGTAILAVPVQRFTGETPVPPGKLGHDPVLRLHSDMEGF
jgi:hypothetical protein